jgi:DUF4097 and DUF4098 domain-containing protein YvlB
MKAWRKFLVVALSVSTVAWAGTEVDKTCDAPPDVHVRVKNVAGSVRIQAWDTNQVRVTGTLGQDVERLEFVCSEKLAAIEVIVPKSHHPDIDSDLTISVPKGSSLEAETVSADLRVSNVGGAIDASTVSGDLNVEGAAGTVEAESISGDVSVSANSPSVEVKSTSGDAAVSGNVGAVRAKSISGAVTVSGTVTRVDAESISGDVSVEKVLQQAEASTVSGDIRISGERLSAGEFSTTSGDVDFTGDLTETGMLKVSTKSGAVTVHVPESIAARFDVSTLSGDIKNDFGPPPERASSMGPGLKLQFGSPDAAAVVKIESLSGGIAIGRE